jgi:hypothetical protein
LAGAKRAYGVAAWTAITLTDGDTLYMPEIGIEILVAELYEDDLHAAADGAERAQDTEYRKSVARHLASHPAALRVATRSPQNTASW